MRSLLMLLPIVVLLAAVPLALEGGRDGVAVRGDGDAAPAALRVVSTEGHATHPTWYHTSQLVEIGDRVFAAWNGDGRVFVAELRAPDLEPLGTTQVNQAALGGLTDSTGTDTNRHDVPALVADGGDRLHVLYGGGSIAARGESFDGPYWRAGAESASLSPERALEIGGGAAYDFEAAEDAGGVQHLVGQRGRGNTGSLIELRLAPDGRWLEPREVVRGGFRADGCVLDGEPRGCNRFAIARLLADPARDRLHLVWGWSEDSLSGKCHTDAGYCDHDLFYAYSDDRGESWQAAGGDARAWTDDGPLDHADARYRVLEGHVGLFKAVAAGPGGPLVVVSRPAQRGMALHAVRFRDGEWKQSQVIAAGGFGSESWEGSLVLRADPRGYTLWTATGSRIVRFFSADDGLSWRARLAYRGAAWSLTGAPARADGEQFLMWRGGRGEGGSEVVLGRFPAGGEVDM